MFDRSKAGAILGRIKTEKKAEASRQNGRRGGRPRTYPPCSRYHAHRFSPTTGRCPCGYQKPKKEKRHART